MAAKKILIVEDDPVGRQILHKALRDARYDTAIAADAMAALTQAKQFKPDLILLDLGLPAGGGFTFLERLRMFPALAVTPVIVVSGQERSQNEERAEQSGVVAYLQKPIDHNQVVAKVREILGD